MDNNSNNSTFKSDGTFLARTNSGAPRQEIVAMLRRAATLIEDGIDSGKTQFGDGEFIYNVNLA